MGAQRPQELAKLFEKRRNEKDVDGLLELYDPACIFVLPDGTTVAGLDKIREQLEGFVSAAGTLTLDTRHCFVTGEIALLHSAWSIGTDMGGVTAEVVRRQPDGSWKYLIDNPYGSALGGT